MLLSCGNGFFRFDFSAAAIVDAGDMNTNAPLPATSREWNYFLFVVILAERRGQNNHLQGSARIG
ncbi:MAG: hypothetical protein WCP19_14795 [Chloroflexota bacterium]